MRTTEVSHDGREFDLIPGRKYVKIAEWLGSRTEGQRTVRAFYEPATGFVYYADGWKARGRMMAESGAQFFRALID